MLTLKFTTISLHKICAAFVTAAVALYLSLQLFIPTNALDESVTINNVIPLITEMTKIWARFSGMEDEWREIFPDLDSREVIINSTQEYLLDYETMLRYTESVFTKQLASDMLHRKESGLFCHEGKFYFHSGWVTMQFRPVFYEKDEPHRDLSITIPAKNIKIISEEDNKLTVTVRYYIHTGYTTETPREEYNETVEFLKTEKGWRISGGSMIRSLFSSFPVYSYDINNPLTGSHHTYSLMLAAITTISAFA